MSQTQEKQKKKFKFPHTYVIICMLIIAATALTYLIPAGSYVRVENAQGINVVDPEQFSYIEPSPVSPFEVPILTVQTFSSSATLMFLVLFAGAAFHMLTLAGGLQTGISILAKKFSNKLHIFVPVLMLAFALTCLTQGPDPYVALVPLMVAMSMALGLDSITGVAIILLGGAVGFSTGTLNPSTTIVAQQIGEVPLYSGLEFRMICFVVFYIITAVFLTRYALKVKKDPTISPMYDLDKLSSFDASAYENIDTKMTLNKVLQIVAMLVAIVSIAGGGIMFGWGLAEMSAVFLVLAIVVGFLAKFTPSEIAVHFLAGCRQMMGAVIIVGLARTIGVILTQGQIIDTVVRFIATSLDSVPTLIQGPAMMIANMLINIAIPSGSGQAAAVMPIMIPVADFIGMNRQIAILAFNFGDGFANYIFPTVPGMMSIIGAANIPYERWVQFIGKLFLIWVVVGSVLLMIAQAINLGPV